MKITFEEKSDLLKVGSFTEGEVYDFNHSEGSDRLKVGRYSERRLSLHSMYEHELVFSSLVQLSMAETLLMTGHLVKVSPLNERDQ